MNIETQPEALRLADALENGSYLLSVERAATCAELRRLHAIEAEHIKLCRDYQDTWDSRDRLHAENQQLRTDLEAVGAGGVGPLMPPPAVKDSLTDEQPRGDGWPEVARLLKTVKYLLGIAERGTGRKVRDGETVEQFVLGYVKSLEQPRKPLTDEEITEITDGLLKVGASMHDFARAIERAHGIGAKP